MVSISTIRAPLFVPANRPERFSKAAASGADAVILDLEDAISSEEKGTARKELTRSFTELPVIVRINAVGTKWHKADLEAVRNIPFSAVMVPKAESVKGINEILDELGDQVSIIALIETARGIAEARSIAMHSNVERLEPES
ncbi:MAG: hypothetical protein JKY41_13600 [Rhodobacteraceae bacterium]|nr:hypothetical protein [Paracoccaceae bacterium]